jgi:ribosomal protein S15P/S13E
MNPSAIGVLLRDSHGIPMVNTVTGSKILRILKGSGLAPDIPEDLYFLIKKAVSMRKHLERNRKDKDGKFRLILIESRIHRLARYYKVQTGAAAAAAAVLAVGAVGCCCAQQDGVRSGGVHGCVCCSHASACLARCCLCSSLREQQAPRQAGVVCAAGPMLVEVASGYDPGVHWWLALDAAARHHQHPGCGAHTGPSCVLSTCKDVAPCMRARTAAVSSGVLLLLLPLLGCIHTSAGLVWVWKCTWLLLLGYVATAAQ